MRIPNCNSTFIPCLWSPDSSPSADSVSFFHTYISESKRKFQDLHIFSLMAYIMCIFEFLNVLYFSYFALPYLPMLPTALRETVPHNIPRIGRTLCGGRFPRRFGLAQSCLATGTKLLLVAQLVRIHHHGTICHTSKSRVPYIHTYNRLFHIHRFSFVLDAFIVYYSVIITCYVFSVCRRILQFLSAVVLR